MPRRTRLPTKRKKTATSTEIGIVHGFRSGLEEENARLLLGLGVEVTYEQHKLEYVVPSVLKRYTPDFILPNGIVIETKGWFNTEDRKKHKFIKDCHPELDLRFVFHNPHQRISKQSQTTYAKWCVHYGFQWADTHIPIAWVNEPATKKRIAATEKVLKWQQPKRSKS